MTSFAQKAAPMTLTREIVFDEFLPHAPETIWKTLTSGALMSRWMMEPTGFAPVPGTHFTFQTTPAGAWDGIIHCEVLDVVPNERLAFAWRGGHESNVGYGSRLETVVSFALMQVGGGTRLHFVHSGFVLPGNQTAYANMSEGWKTVIGRIRTVSDDQMH